MRLLFLMWTTPQSIAAVNLQSQGCAKAIFALYPIALGPKIKYSLVQCFSSRATRFPYIVQQVNFSSKEKKGWSVIIRP